MSRIYASIEPVACPLNGPLELDVSFFITPPKKQNPNFPYPSKADLDNYLKLFMDAANKILWYDDRQIVKITARKNYCELQQLSGIRYNVFQKENPKEPPCSSFRI